VTMTDGFWFQMGRAAAEGLVGMGVLTAIAAICVIIVILGKIFNR